MNTHTPNISNTTSSHYLIVYLCGLLVFFTSFANAQVLHSDNFLQAEVKHNKLDLHPAISALENNYLRLEYGQLKERDKNGKVVSRQSLKHGSWPTVMLNDGIYVIPFIATKKNKRRKSDSPEIEIAQVMVHTGILTSSTIEDVLCPACSGGSSGTCQNAASKICGNPNNGKCPRRFSPCTENVIVEKPTLKFSFELPNWEFQSEENTLHFQVEIELRKERNAFDISTKNDTSNLLPEGFLTLPVTAIVIDDTGAKRIIGVDVSIKELKKNKMLIDVGIPFFPAGDAFFWD